MAPSAESPESDVYVCSQLICRFASFSGLLFGTVISTIIGACIYTIKPTNILLLTVLGGSFQMDTSLQGNVTLRFTLRAQNPTSCSISYTNISWTLAVLNDEYGENKDHFISVNVTDFDVQQQAFVDSPTQVTATNLSIAEYTIVLVLQLNGTMETSSRNSTSVGYRCRISTSGYEYDKACSRVRKIV